MRGRNRINIKILGILTLVSMLFSVFAAAFPVYAESTGADSAAAESKAAAASEDQALTNLVDGWPAMRDINEQSGYIIDADNKIIVIICHTLPLYTQTKYPEHII